MSVPSNVIPKKYLKRPVNHIKSSNLRIKYNDAMKTELRRCKADPLYFLVRKGFSETPYAGSCILYQNSQSERRIKRLDFRGSRCQVEN